MKYLKTLIFSFIKVVWNPWIDKARAMSDFGDEEYKRMVCVEAGHIQNRHVLKSNEKIKMGQEIVAQI